MVEKREHFLIEEFKEEIRGMLDYPKVSSFLKEWAVDGFIIVKIDRDIIEYFLDLAKMTDNVEKGGILLGESFFFTEEAEEKGHKLEKVEFKGKNELIGEYYYDYIQCRNVAGDRENYFLPAEGCAREVNSQIEQGTYNTWADVHTHPDESLPSALDFKKIREYYKKGDWDSIEFNITPKHFRFWTYLNPALVYTKKGGIIMENFPLAKYKIERHYKKVPTAKIYWYQGKIGLLKK